MIFRTTHAAVGFAVTPKCAIRRRSWCSTMNSKRRWHVAVDKTKKSMHARQFAWFRKNVRQVGGGGFGARVMYLDTVASETLMPSFMSSLRSWRAPPERVLPDHPTNEFADLARNRRPSSFPSSRLPGPKQAEAFPMPGDDGLRHHNDEGIQAAGPQTVEPNPKCPVEGSEPRPLVLLSLEDRQLVAMSQDLKLELGVGPKPDSYVREQKSYSASFEGVDTRLDGIRGLARGLKIGAGPPVKISRSTCHF